AADSNSVFSVTVTNSSGSIVSNNATLSVIGPTLPVIVTQPAGVSVTEGSAATFTVVASGESLEYQWLRDGAHISGATGPSYTLLSASAGDNQATFVVVVANSAGQVISANAVLTVLPSSSGIPPVPTTPTEAAASFKFTINKKDPIGAKSMLISSKISISS